MHYRLDEVGKSCARRRGTKKSSRLEGGSGEHHLEDADDRSGIEGIIRQYFNQGQSAAGSSLLVQEGIFPASSEVARRISRLARQPARQEYRNRAKQFPHADGIKNLRTGDSG